MEIPDKVEMIGGQAFQDCYALTSIILPKAITTIGESALTRCYALSTVYYCGTATEWKEVECNIGATSNENLDSATKCFYSEIPPALNNEGTAYNGNYWHYVDGVPTVWVYNSKQ